MNEHYLTKLYGPAPKYSDHKQGERITFDSEGQTYTGVILWVCAADQPMPVRYIVEADQREGFLCVIFPCDIIQTQ